MNIIQIISAFLVHRIIYFLVFEDILQVYGDISQEIVEQGKIQYQMLKERSNLPQYGNCWKSAVEHVNEGCKHLSEDTQSDIALHITNCFLGMSGHETYNCQHDRKPNLRAICINSMSDRAFNVYTEFYTHTQNICWFLRGQIWHEKIAENTWRVGKQLEVSAENQLELLKAQKESLEVQEKILKHGKFLEHVLEDLYISSKVMTDNLSSLQAWIVGEVSWLDSLIFYITFMFLSFLITSSKRTASSRLPIFGLLFLNIFVERLVSSILLGMSSGSEAQNMYSNIQFYVWLTRYIFIAFCMILVIYNSYTYQDLAIKNNALLSDIQKQNQYVVNILKSLKNNFNLDFNERLDILNENNIKTLETKLTNLNNFTNVEHSTIHPNQSEQSNFSSTKINSSYKKNNNFNYHSATSTLDSCNVSICFDEQNTKADKFDKSNFNKRKYLSVAELHDNKYNLRSRQGTPDSVKYR